MKFFNVFVCGMSLMAAVACGSGAAEKKECAVGGKCEKSCENAVVENIMSRRSVRKYKDTPVPREVLNTILKCGIYAPNGQNKQSWEVRVVDNEALQAEIKTAMAANGNERAAGCFYNAPVWVFIARDKGYDFSAYDCGLLAENIMLSAHSLGVGSVCLGSPVRFILDSPQKEAVLSKLGFSEGYELSLCISLGYPDEVPVAKPRDFGKVKFVE